MLENNGQSKKNSDYSASSEAFSHAVRVLLFGYALVSAGGGDGPPWCDLQSAFLHIAKVEKFCKLDSKTGYTFQSKIMEAENATRNERAMAGQQSPHLTLSEIIIVIANRHSLWPSVTEFPTSKKLFDQGNRDND